jgi:hypothetical protein
MDRSNRKRKKQLGVSFGTACARLRKAVMFQLAQETHRDVCFRCGKLISTIEDFSLDHKHPWLDAENPGKMFFDLENIAFSHYRCNVGAARKPTKKYFTKESKLAARRKNCAASMRRNYTTARRRNKFRRTGW